MIIANVILKYLSWLQNIENESDGRFSPAFEERLNEAADENVPPLNLPKDVRERQRGNSVGTDTARSTLQE